MVDQCAAGGGAATPAVTVKHGVTKWSISSPVWATLWASATSGGSHTSVTETEEVRDFSSFKCSFHVSLFLMLISDDQGSIYPIA